MSFVLELSTPKLDPDVAERIERTTHRPGHVPVQRARQRSGGALRIEDRLLDGTPVLDDQANWDEDAFTLNPSGRDALARTLLLLSELLSPGWALRAYWIGDPIQHEQPITAERLAELARRSALARTTRYVVTSAPTAQ
jgi:hypothetical protein